MVGGVINYNTFGIYNIVRPDVFNNKHVAQVLNLEYFNAENNPIYGNCISEGDYNIAIRNLNEIADVVSENQIRNNYINNFRIAGMYFDVIQNVYLGNSCSFSNIANTPGNNTFINKYSSDENSIDYYSSLPYDVYFNVNPAVTFTQASVNYNYFSASTRSVTSNVGTYFPGQFQLSTPGFCTYNDFQASGTCGSSVKKLASLTNIELLYGSYYNVLPIYVNNDYFIIDEYKLDSFIKIKDIDNIGLTYNLIKNNGAGGEFDKLKKRLPLEMHNEIILKNGLNIYKLEEWNKIDKNKFDKGICKLKEISLSSKPYNQIEVDRIYNQISDSFKHQKRLLYNIITTRNLDLESIDNEKFIINTKDRIKPTDVVITNNDFVISPNPTSLGLFTILNTNRVLINTVSILDNTGKKINEYLLNSNEKIQNVSTFGLATGSYIIRIEAGNIMSTKKLFIIR
jgi:hypothetical protein